MSSYINRKRHPELRTISKRKEKIRRRLRDIGILPPVGVTFNEEQKIIYNQIGNGDFSFWNSIKNSRKFTIESKQRQLDVGILKKQNIKSIQEQLWYRAKSNSKKKNL